MNKYVCIFALIFLENRMIVKTYTADDLAYGDTEFIISNMLKGIILHWVFSNRFTRSLNLIDNKKDRVILIVSVILVMLVFLY